MSSTAKDKSLTNDILIIDDEADICLLIEGILNDEGWKTRKANSAEKALAEIASRRPNLVILDIWLQGSGMDGMQLLDRLVREHPEVPVIMISGHGNIETAVSAIKRGAYDFIEKPFKADRLVLQVQHALSTARLKRENEELKARAGTDERKSGFDSWCIGGRERSGRSLHTCAIQARRWCLYRRELCPSSSGAN
jgi:two-component system nitrogen regulation response regulator NtrX